MQVNAVNGLIGNSPGFCAVQNANIAGSIAANSARYTRSLRQASSGLRLATAGDGPADLAISERLRSEFRRDDAAVGNAENAISYLSTSDAYLQNIQNMTDRMGELAVLANDGTKSDVDRSALQAEFSALQNGIADITSGSNPLASFNGKPLFQGQSIASEIGPEGAQTITINSPDLTTTSLGVIGTNPGGGALTWGNMLSGSVNISSQANASSAVNATSMAGDYLSGVRATQGAQYARLLHTVSGLRSSQDNVLTTESRIRDMDMATAATDLSRYRSLTILGRTILGNQTGNILATA